MQDNPVSDRALSIITENNNFCMELAMRGTVVYEDTFTQSDKELHECPHIILSLPHTWDPHNVSFPKPRRTLEEEMGSPRYVSELLIHLKLTVTFKLIASVYSIIFSCSSTQLNRIIESKMGT